jgi:hypothetical protein
MPGKAISVRCTAVGRGLTRAYAGECPMCVCAIMADMVNMFPCMHVLGAAAYFELIESSSMLLKDIVALPTEDAS